MHHRIAVIFELSTAVQYNFKNPGSFAAANGGNAFQTAGAQYNFRNPGSFAAVTGGNTFQTVGCPSTRNLIWVQVFQQQETAECLMFICCDIVIRRALDPWACQIVIKTEEECREISSLLYSLSAPSYTRLERVPA